MGNSEVGHLNLGAGRIVYQDLTRINKAIEEGELTRNQSIAGNLCGCAGSSTSFARAGFRRRCAQPLFAHDRAGERGA